jgi:two-component system NarL family sensor kinase
VTVIALDLPDEGGLAVILGAAAVPWALALLLLAHRSPTAALSPLIPLGDLAVLLAVEVAVPEAYGAVRFAALFLIAVHAHFQGELRGLAVALPGSLALVAATVARGDTVVRGDTLAFYESAFVVASVGSALILGRLRTAESASRLRARGLTRRSMEAERAVRRRVAESIHDGPVQELIGLDMVLSAAGQAAERGDRDRVGELLRDARELTERNVQMLRDEIVDMGPYASDELTYEMAVHKCAAVWERRYEIAVLLQLEHLELSPEAAGELFLITQEAVINAGRHAEAGTVSITLRSLGRELELRVVDDGKGFGEVDPLGAAEPGHVGLANMRERAELLDGELHIDTSEEGTTLVVRAPYGLAARSGRATGD